MFESVSKGEDVINLLRLIWRKKYKFLVSCSVAFVVALIIGFSIPKTYESSVVLAPESAKASSWGALSSLASFAGFDMSGLQQEDALYPELYPQIVSSTAFLEELYSMNVVSKDGEINTTLYSYIQSYQKKPWWGVISDLPQKVKSWFVTKQRMAGDSLSSGSVSPLTYRVYSEEQTSVMNKLKKMIVCTVDVGNNVITINVEMQDPYIAAQVASRVAELLQQKVSEYRTSKSVKDYEYSLELYEAAKEDYYTKQSVFADYLDNNALGVTLARYRKDGDRLEDEMTLAYTIYCQLAQQKEIALAKVQEHTPVFTVIQPPYVPTLHSSPSKVFLIISFVILTLFGHIIWIIVKKDVKRTLKNKKQNE